MKTISYQASRHLGRKGVVLGLLLVLILGGLTSGLTLVLNHPSQSEAARSPAERLAGSGGGKWNGIFPSELPRRG